MEMNFMMPSAMHSDDSEALLPGFCQHIGRRGRGGYRRGRRLPRQPGSARKLPAAQNRQIANGERQQALGRILAT
jgi:hypothetical protein